MREVQLRYFFAQNLKHIIMEPNEVCTNVPKDEIFQIIDLLKERLCLIDTYAYYMHKKDYADLLEKNNSQMKESTIKLFDTFFRDRKTDFIYSEIFCNKNLIGIGRKVIEFNKLHENLLISEREQEIEKGKRLKEFIEQKKREIAEKEDSLLFYSNTEKEKIK